MLSCPSCGKKTTKTEEFCPHCGISLTNAATAQALSLEPPYKKTSSSKESSAKPAGGMPIVNIAAILIVIGFIGFVLAIGGITALLIIVAASEPVRRSLDYHIRFNTSDGSSVHT